MPPVHTVLIFIHDYNDIFKEFTEAKNASNTDELNKHRLPPLTATISNCNHYNDSKVLVQVQYKFSFSKAVTLPQLTQIIIQYYIHRTDGAC